jgi:penicillin-binding protein 2
MPSGRDDIHGRINALAVAILLVIAALVARLWYLQVLSGESYAALSENNRLREVSLDAPRGLILDRAGEILVGDRPALAVTAAPALAKNRKVLARLSKLLGVPVAEILKRLNDKRPSALKSRRIAEDVPIATITALKERGDLYPGVEVETISLRRYPYRSFASHLLGYVGEASEVDLADPRFARYQYSDIIGKTGIERQYETVLQGAKGSRLLEVDASGRPLREVRRTQPAPGFTLMLSIDRKAQQETELQLAEAVKAAHRGGFKKANAGAAVVMDVRTGQIIALASYPTYDPTAFLGGIPTPLWKKLNNKKSQYPLFDRAITGAYPPGSTFKPVTGGAGLAAGVVTPQTTFDCLGKWTDMGKQWPKWCWNKSGHGPVAFMDAYAQSCDVYFYNIGLKFYRRHIGSTKLLQHDKGIADTELQAYARKFGFGARTGIDLAGEVRGRIPDPQWKADFNKNSPQYAPWLPGDTVNLAIGQGDMLATPIQIVRMYAAIANGGTLWRPQIVGRILTPSGEVSHLSKPIADGHLPLTASQIRLLQAALVGVVQNGTAKAAFAGFKYPVAGKTGTSQVTKKDDFALFAGYAPANAPRYAAVMVVEQGGHGGSIAAPAVRNIFASLLGAPIANVNPNDLSR